MDCDLGIDERDAPDDDDDDNYGAGVLLFLGPNPTSPASEHEHLTNEDGDYGSARDA